MRPLIGITTYPKNTAGRYDLPVEYVLAVRRAGGLPVLLPPGEEATAELLARLDGLILAGGGDVDPALYGGTPHPEIDRVDTERDATEIDYARRLVADGVPALCICRGAQVLNVALGGSLVEHLPDEVGGAIPHRSESGEKPPRHEVEVEPGSHLAEVMGTTRPMPESRHHQAPRAVAEPLRPVAWAADDTIEALEPREVGKPGAHPWLLAVQWHPEATADGDASQQRLFDALVQAAAERRSRSAGG
ncbi:MAG TPA: gamma-glutamyl-gamma-aminobutyrate hydrolase family protein [Thermoanaerobaculia bacterium]|jgi:putative glutamine amidotransferase|nr:gamma-glutamyl-gamma-aminobutyrate hydrolase family protein [Thermoanaerobaculia bacterium]